MAQKKVNGKAKAGQFVVGSLTHYEVDAKTNVSVFGWTYNVSTKVNEINPGEELLQLIGTVCNPVIVESSSTSGNVVFIAAEVAGHTASDIANVINSSDTFTGATVTVGTYAVDTP